MAPCFVVSLFVRLTGRRAVVRWNGKTLFTFSRFPPQLPQTEQAGPCYELVPLQSPCQRRRQPRLIPVNPCPPSCLRTIEIAGSLQQHRQRDDLQSISRN